MYLQEMQRLQKRSSPQVPELPALAEEQFSTAKAMYNLTDELDALARLENKKQVSIEIFVSES